MVDLDKIAAAFDARAPRYNANEWHLRNAERLVVLAGLRPGDRVLDAGTGTGLAAIAASQYVEPTGWVVGVDISDGMLREAKRAAAKRGFSNLSFLTGDATGLPQFSEAAFDAVICAAGLLYMPIQEALQEWRRLLKPGGRLGFSSMRDGFPRAATLFRKCAAEFGIDLEDPNLLLGSATKCRAALERAGFRVENVFLEQITLSPQDFRAAWDSHVSSPAYLAIHCLSSARLAQLRARFVAALREEDDRSFQFADALYAFGTKPK